MFFAAGCANKSKQDENALSQEDMKAKQLLQGIWLNEDEEDVVFKVQEDTIYYIKDKKNGMNQKKKKKNKDEM